ncbi:MAG: alpha-galactosidase [Candidatus Hydrogenedentes bacterium]|nr:alpha-galactosidase [Candidatus Hydrogenedentota bacterium]
MMHSCRSSMRVVVMATLTCVVCMVHVHAQDPGATGEVKVQMKPDDWLWSASWEKTGIGFADAGAQITVDDTAYGLRPLAPPAESAVEDALGNATETSCSLGAENLPLSVTLRLRRYDDQAIVAIQGEVVNTAASPVSLGDFELITPSCVNLGRPGGEARVYIEHSPGHPAMEPLLATKDNAEVVLDADSSGMLTVGFPTGPAFTAGFVTSQNHRPVVHIRYAADTAEALVTGVARFNGRRLAPGERVETGWLVLRTDANSLHALETYGDLLARVTPPRLTPATIGWCSWYAIRLPISHAFTMANAQVVAERFRDLGMDLMLLDHGWQTGDICGDWDVDTADYPGGLEALAADLRTLGLKLGIWIAPTEVSETSQLYQEHPDWMLRDASGKPAVTWTWYWAPNPKQFQIDATQQGAYDYIVNTFSRLTKAGASYYKIDFIAGCSGENLYPADPANVRGWDPLRRAMEAVREGAGDAAYIRYCQTPPLLSTGLADGVYATTDTLDAGTSTWPTLKEVFAMSSAEYWIQGRLYNHEACDLSIRAPGGTEECRLRATMFALSGSSIMYSDDMTILPEERIRIMQQTMPGFTKAARPLNLFASDMPDVWHLHCASGNLEWELLAFFNFTDEERSFSVTWGEMGLPSGISYIAREFWTDDFRGISQDALACVVPGKAVRLFALWPLLDRPQFAGTNLHLSQGQAELTDLNWDEAQGTLSGTIHRAAGLRGHVYTYLPPAWEFARASAPVQHLGRGLHALELVFDNADEDWEIIARRKCLPEQHNATEPHLNQNTATDEHGL